MSLFTSRNIWTKLYVKHLNIISFMLEHLISFAKPAYYILHIDLSMICCIHVNPHIHGIVACTILFMSSYNLTQFRLLVASLIIDTIESCADISTRKLFSRLLKVVSGHTLGLNIEFISSIYQLTCPWIPTN